MRRSTAAAILLMRFEGNRPQFKIKEVHASMKPKSLPPDFTPFPLPKHDDSLGFGPTRLQHVPDIAKARRAVALEMDTLSELLNLSPSAVEENLAESHSDETMDAREASSPSPAAEPYEQEAGYPLLNRLVCNRPVEKLFEQYLRHPSEEGKAAALSDLASMLPRLSNNDLTKIFNFLGEQFQLEGLGLHFHAYTVHGMASSFRVFSCRYWAYVNFIEAVDVLLTETQPERLVEGTDMMISMLHFFGKIKIFQPNLWIAKSATNIGNNFDSYSSIGKHKHFHFKQYFRELHDQLQQLIVSTVLVDGTDNSVPFVCGLTLEQLVEAFCGFSSIDPQGLVHGPTANELLTQFKFLAREKRKSEALTIEASRAIDDAVEKMFFSATMASITDRELFELAKENSDPSGDYFVALSRCKPLSDNFAESEIRKAMQKIRIEMPSLSSRSQYTLEGISELLMMFSSREAAVSIVREFDIDSMLLARVPHFNKILGPSLTGEQEAVATTTRRADRLSRSLAGLKANLDGIRRFAKVSVLHSSVPRFAMTQFIHFIRQLKSGRVGCIVSTQTITALDQARTVSVRTKEQENADRALKVIAYEAKQGRIVIVPFSEELEERDAALFADEDVVTWALASTLVQRAPMVSTSVLAHHSDEASKPHKYLKGCGWVDTFVSTHELGLHHASLGADKKRHRVSRLFGTLELQVHAPALKEKIKRVKDKQSSIRRYNPRRANLAYRRDKALFDKFHVHGRNNALGFGRGGSTDHDMRGLGIHTPDHPQPKGTREYLS